MSIEKYGKSISHPNIAIIKYWGKKDVIQNIPTNPSLSFTLSNLKTETEIFENENDEFYLNGILTEIKERMQLVLDKFKKMSEYKKGIKIISTNNFAHGCGLASSASGYSALVLALNNFFNLKLNQDELSKLARFGSGSAARSIFNGFSLFKNESAQKIGDWSDLRIMVLITEQNEKKVGSTEGMIRTVKTSSFFKERLKNIQKKIDDAIFCINNHNFEELMILMMRESNEMHSVILDSWPPVFYLNNKSFEVIELCQVFNKNQVKVGYTFDAGPNPFIFTLEKYFEEAKEFFRLNSGCDLIVCH